MVELSNNDEDSVEEIWINPDHLDRTVRIKTSLLVESMKRLIDLLKEIIHCFS